jgi:hypothetical protein
MTRWEDSPAWYEVLNPWGAAVQADPDPAMLDQARVRTDVVQLTEALSGAWWDRPQVGHGTYGSSTPTRSAGVIIARRR